MLVRVVDADTIECEPRRTVRLIGIDAPEGDQEPFGSIARTALVDLLRPGTLLQLEVGSAPRDRFGRTLAYAWLKGELLNLKLVEEGWAVELTYSPNTRYAPQITAAESKASRERAGLWNLNGFACRPIDRRRRVC